MPRAVTRTRSTGHGATAGPWDVGRDTQGGRLESYQSEFTLLVRDLCSSSTRYDRIHWFSEPYPRTEKLAAWVGMWHFLLFPPPTSVSDSWYFSVLLGF